MSNIPKEVEERIGKEVKEILSLNKLHDRERREINDYYDRGAEICMEVLSGVNDVHKSFEAFKDRRYSAGKVLTPASYDGQVNIMKEFANFYTAQLKASHHEEIEKLKGLLKEQVYAKCYFFEELNKHGLVPNGDDVEITSELKELMDIHYKKVCKQNNIEL